MGIRAPHPDADQMESPFLTAPLGWLDAALDARPSIRLAGRAALGVSDQAFVSLVNFALGVTVARLVSPTDFGAFGVAFAVYLVALNIARGFATQPLAIRFGNREADEFRRGTGQAVGLAALLGVVLGVICVVLGLLFPAPLSGALVALGLSLPGLLIQDAWRFVFFTARQGRKAIVNDVTWTMVLAVSIAFLLMRNQASVSLLILSWGIGASAAAAVGIGQTAVLPDFRRAMSWWREHWDITPRFLGSELLQMAGLQFALLSIGALAGLAAVGSMRGAQILLGPTFVLAVGVHLTMVPEAARLRGAIHRLRQLMILASAGLGLVGFAWGAVLLLVPDSIGRELLGASWEGTTYVLLPVVVFSVAPLLATGPRIGLRAMEEAPATLRAAGLQSVFTIVGGIGGALVGDVSTAAWGLAIGNCLALLVWLSESIAALRRLTREANERNGPVPQLTVEGDPSAPS